MIVDSCFGFKLAVHQGSYIAGLLRDGAAYEPLESKLAQSLIRPGDFCIDAGAHVGYYARLMCESGAEVIAIEPNPNHVDVLRGNLTHCKAKVFACALSDRFESDVPFYLPSAYDDGWGSLATSDIGQTHPIKVATWRLDAILAVAYAPKSIRLLKLDVEGAEVPALCGLGQRLNDVEYMLIECMDIAGRMSDLHSSTDGIMEVLKGWTIKQACIDGAPVEKALSGGNYLFVNPKCLAQTSPA